MTGSIWTVIWRWVWYKCSWYSIYPAVWRHRVFKDENIMYLYTTNKEFHANNANVMKSLYKPIPSIEAWNTGNASWESNTVVRLLAYVLFPWVNVSVMTTSNILQRHGLCYGSTGLVRDIIYKADEFAPSLPNCLWVDFDDQYNGPMYFPNDKNWRGWVPILKTTTILWTQANTTQGYEEHSCIIPPLKCCWAWTVYK